MNEDEKILFILNSLAMNYPVLTEGGLRLSKPILLVGERGQTYKIVNSLNVDSRYVHPFSKRQEILETIRTASSQFIVFAYSQSRNAEEILSIFESISNAGYIEKHMLNSQLLVVTEGIPDALDLDNYFTVFVSEKAECQEYDERKIALKDKEVPVVIDVLSKTLEATMSMEEKVLLAAVCFLYPKLSLNEFEDLLSVAKKMVLYNDDNQTAYDIGPVFVKTLYTWQNKEDFHNLVQLPNLPQTVIADLENYILFDEKSLYLPESLFKKIITPMTAFFSTDMVKRALVQEDYLVPDKGKSYTYKVGFYNVFGVYNRKRMLRFKRERLNMLGELDFVSLCQEGI